MNIKTSLETHQKELQSDFLQKLKEEQGEAIKMAQNLNQSILDASKLIPQVNKALTQTAENVEKLDQKLNPIKIRVLKSARFC